MKDILGKITRIHASMDIVDTLKNKLKFRSKLNNINGEINYSNEVLTDDNIEKILSNAKIDAEKCCQSLGIIVKEKVNHHQLQSYIKSDENEIIPKDILTIRNNEDHDIDTELLLDSEIIHIVRNQIDFEGIQFENEESGKQKLYIFY
jgi:hypothetical protein